MPPKETQAEWIRFLATEPNPKDLSDWLNIKAAEVGWDYFDLTEALMLGVQKASLPEPDRQKDN